MSSLRVYECSHRVAWIFGQYKKPFTDGGVVKEYMSAVTETETEMFLFKIKYFILRCTIFKELFYLFSLMYFLMPYLP